MTTFISNVAKATFFLAAISLCWLVFDLIVLAVNFPDILLFGLWSGVAGAGYIFILAFHAFAFLMLILHLRKIGRDGILRTVSFITGLLSLIAICVEKVFYDEIGREFGAGFAIGNELKVLALMLMINAVFAAIMMLVVFRTYRAVPEMREEVIRDEKVFLLAQYMGAVSGLSGLYLTVSLIGRSVPVDRFWIYLPFYALLLFPYGVTVLYWLVMKAREKVFDWYDEKQLRDMMKASLTTLILSVPGMAALLLFNGSIAIYWFPYYLFMALMLFSGSTLFYFRQA